MPSRAAARIQAEKRATQARIAFAERQQQARRQCGCSQKLASRAQKQL